jgi:uncharacterized protein YmfQ (DUF2313 family)
MTACNGVPSSDICPTQDEIIPQLLALLPRGRAWRTHAGTPEPTSTIYKYWYALADVWAWVNQRICALRKEFWCATASETIDLWMAEYGLPDGCDPHPDLCTKVAALGGVTCDYFASIAARAGWSITCEAYDAGCGAMAGCAFAGGSMAGLGLGASTLLIIVSLGASPAYQGSYQTPPMAGALFAGAPLACAPNIVGLQCLMARIVGAHIVVLFETTP